MLNKHTWQKRTLECLRNLRREMPGNIVPNVCGGSMLGYSTFCEVTGIEKYLHQRLDWQNALLVVFQQVMSPVGF